MTIVYQNDFVAADGTDASLVAPTVGSNNLVVSLGVMRVTSNRIRRETTEQFPLYSTNQTIGTADYTVAANGARLIATGVTYNLSLSARLTDSSNRYRLTYSSATNELSVFRHIASASGTIMGTAVSWTPSAGVNYVFAFEVSGVGATVTLRGLIDGVQLISRTDTASDRIVTTGQAGITISGNTGDNGATTGWAVDQLVIDTLTTSPTPTPAFGRYGVRSPSR